MRTVSLEAACKALSDAFGESVQICLQPGIDPNALEEVKRSSLWACDLFSDPPEMAKRGDGRFFTVVMDNSGGFWQPLVVDEPKSQPGENVGTVRATVRRLENGQIMVKVVRPKRPGAGGQPVLESDRASLSKDPNFGATDQEVGKPVYSNSARIGRGPVRVVFTEVGDDSLVEGQEWMDIATYIREGTDPLGITATVRAVFELGYTLASPKAVRPGGPRRKKAQKRSKARRRR